MSDEITTKDGLLWQHDAPIGLPRADAVAQEHGFHYAEQMVRALEKGATVARVVTAETAHLRPRTYFISSDGKSIACRICGKISHHPKDVAQKYCGHCHLFHDDSPFQA